MKRYSAGLLGLLLAMLTLAACENETATGTVSANAGDDKEVLVGETSTLDGNGSSSVLSSTWTLTSKPSGSSADLTDTDSLSPKLTPDVAGAYVAQLSINDGASTDTATITAKNVIAGITVDTSSCITTRSRFNTTEYVVNLGQSGCVLSAGASKGSVASYSWEQVDGPSATETGGITGSTLTFTAPSLSNFLTTSDKYKWQLLPVSRNDTRMTFRVTVSDSSGNSDSATQVIYVQDNGHEIHTSSGLPNVPVGQVVYLQGPSIKAATASTAVTDWSWSLSVPSGSSATFSDSGGTTSTSQFPKFTPDAEGLYTLTYSSTSGAITSTTLQVNAAKWVGVGTVGGTSPSSPQCATCHSGTLGDDMVTGWSATTHAKLFENAVSTYAGLAPEPYLWQFHTVGYNKDASGNDGFDDLATSYGFTFPSSGMTYSAFTSTYAAVAKLANVQCENCHGPGSQHAGDPLRIEHSASQYGVCGQCHNEEAQWVNSAHNSTGSAHGSAAYQSYWLGADCQRCHTALGFERYTDGTTLSALTSTSETGMFVGVTCAGCHDPHSVANAKQLRELGNVTMVVDSSTVNAGRAGVCYTCHDGLYQYNTTTCDSNSDGNSDATCTTLDQTATQSFRQVHYNPQAPVLEGKGALTDLNGDGTADFSLTENSFHTESTFTLAGVTGNTSLSSDNNKCVTCHMATGPSADETGYLHLGGHSFKLRVGHGIGHLLGEETEDDTAATEEETELTTACTVCHTSVTSFDRTARADYDGDGTIEGIQSEVKGLLVALTTKIKSVGGSDISSTSGTVSSGGTVTVDALSYAGTCSSFTSSSCKAASGTSSCSNVATGKTRNDYQPCNFLDASTTVRRAVWNHNLIARDGSLGVHNAAFTVQLLQKTYTAVGGSSFATDYPSATQR